MRAQTLQTVALAALVFAVSAIGISAQTGQGKAKTAAKKTGTAKASAKKAAPAEPAVALPAEPGLYAILNTSMGVIVARLFEDKTPITVKNFVALAKGLKPSANKSGALVKRPYFNGVIFHRVIKDFMIQTGDVAGTGSGNCGVPTIPDEYDPSLKFDAPGKLAMANIGTPHTGNCQFFITVSKPDYLNGKHTIFGEVVSGQDIADQISQVPTGPNDKPLSPVVLKSVLIRKKEGANQVR